MCLIALLSYMLLSTMSFGQGASASLTGTITDTSDAVIPGAVVVVRNVDTGVETRTTSSNTGTYNFPNLQTGNYTVTAEAPGFSNAVRNDVRLGLGQARLNLSLAVAGTITEVSVTGTSESVLLEAGSSTGTVLQEGVVSDLPLVSNDVMDLINIMGGVVQSEDPIFSNFQQTFAGVQSGNINVSRDGISVSEVRWSSGVVSPSRINPDMVGEFRMILSPVDAELGRGAGQVQITTRSGSNNFHGSGAWNIQNTALDAREFGAKRDNQDPTWRNLNNYTISVSGPIIKNKTFFFATWDHQLVREKMSIRATSLTNCARKGIYRYFDGYAPANALADNGFVENTEANRLLGLVPARPSVNVDGTPAYTWQSRVTGNTVTQGEGDLIFQSVLGDLSTTAYNQIASDPVNCSQYDASLAFSNASFNNAWSRAGIRDSFDQSGYVQRFMGMVPEANAFDIGDGLNIAAYKWTRTVKGANTVYGVGQDSEKKAVSMRIDHNINANHRLSGTYSYDYTIGEDSMPSWNNEYSFGGHIIRKPQSFTVGLTSTLSPYLLNEFRFGMSRTLADIYDPLRASPDGLGKVLNDLLPVSSQLPVVVGYDNLGFSPGYDWVTMAFIAGNPVSHPFGSMSVQGGSWGGEDNRWTASDTVTWLKGAHSFKSGFEVRLQKSMQTANSEGGFVASSMYPSVSGGVMNTSGYQNDEFGWTNLTTNPTTGAPMPDGTGMAGMEAQGQGGYGNVRNLLNWFSGSVAEIQQFFYAADAKTRSWNDYLAGQNYQKVDLRNREFAFFFKDDWKATNDLTLNLGVRWEYYGAPWENQGMSVALVGGSQALWGPCGASNFGDFMPANPSGNCGGSLAAYQFVGPNSPNSNLSVWNKDMNNWAPHVGFSYQLPWLGKGLTTLRGGYSISYTNIAQFDAYAGVMSKVPGTQYRQTVGGNEYTYLTLNDLLVNNYNGRQILPLAAPDDEFYGANRIQVLGVQNTDARSATLNVYDDNIRTPYIQNVNLSLTRQVANILTVDVRYIGTFSRKLIGTRNINAANFINNGLFDLLAAARRGEDPAELDALIPSGTLMASFDWETFQPIPISGAEQLRTHFDWATFSGQNTNLATGNFSEIANYLATANGVLQVPSGTRGGVLRAGGAPENYIYANPQFAAANLTTNRLTANYHSMQAQVTLRPTRGLSFQSTYTWSRNLARQAEIPDQRTGENRYYLSNQHRSHTLNTYGSYELPFGANGFLLRDASGAIKKAVEGWQLSWILSLSSGLPGSVTGASTMWGNTDPVLVRPDLWDNKAGKVTWEDGAYNGYFFGDKYIRVTDPQCNNTNIVGPSLQALCANGMKALALRSNPDTIVIRNAMPGEVGNMKPNSLTGPGRWNFDMAMSKSVEFMEGKRIEVRVDAQNIFNHPTPSNSAFAWNARFTQISNPDFALQGSQLENFGVLSTKGGHRTFQAKIRLSF